MLVKVNLSIIYFKFLKYTCLPKIYAIFPFYMNSVLYKVFLNGIYKY